MTFDRKKYMKEYHKKEYQNNKETVDNRNKKYYEQHKDLSGLLSLQYNDNEKIKELQIYEVSEITHDWLRLALRCKTLTLEISGVSRSFVKVGDVS